MEIKWIMIGVAVWMAAMFGSIAVSDYGKAQCRIAYADSKRSVEDIQKVCK